MRAIDIWINANAVTLLATAITSVFAWEWHRDNQRIRPGLTGRLAAMARLNSIVACWVIGINLAVFVLGFALIQVAREMDRNSSAAHPARVPDYVTNGTLAFTAIWVVACGGAAWFRGAMERIIRMEE